MRSFLLTLLCTAGPAWAQSGPMRHNLEAALAGVFPVNGYIADDFSAGPAWRPGYEYRISRLFGAEVGFTQAWLPGTSCSRFGCEHPRETLKFLDYGLRGHLPLRGGKIDLSVGAGGGHIWYQTDRYLRNGTLFQYSAKGAVALDRQSRFRLTLTLRVWRDLGRPTQQWLSTSAGVAYCFGGKL